MSHPTPACVLTLVMKTNGVSMELPTVKDEASILAILNGESNGPGGRWKLPIVTTKKRKLEDTIYQTDEELLYFDAKDIHFFSIEKVSVAPDIIGAGRNIGIVK
jgi:hypothetical protein